MSKIQSIIKNGTLKQKLVELIRFRGPLSVSQYMKLVLTNPESGFYMKENVFGVKGHFITSPEVSQVFGEILGVWVMQEWRRFKCPKPLRLVEFGPGRGTLMSDMIRTLRSFEQVRDDKIHVKMVEISPILTEVQQKALSQYSKEASVKWLSHSDSIRNECNDGFTAYIAHEFLDALPIHKFVRDPNTKRMRELLIDYDENEELRYCIAKEPSMIGRVLVPPEYPGDHLEVCPEAAILLEKVASQLNATNSGCMLVCDYGFEDEEDLPESTIDAEIKVPKLKPVKSNRDTLRAFKDHNHWPTLKDPGHADLTADVDFGYLKRHMKGKATIFGPRNQGEFLRNCGLYARLETLLTTSDTQTREKLISQANMLVHEMGQRYHFMALFPKDSGNLFNDDPPAGFG